MDIIQFLILDHERLRHDRLDIKKSLSEGVILNNRIKKYISDLELHETIENKFLISKLNALPDKEKLDTLVDGYKSEHHKIWEHIQELIDHIQTGRLASIQQTFFNFIAHVEAHVEIEERSFFPTIRKLFDLKTLEELGQKAENYYDRYQQKSVA